MGILSLKGEGQKSYRIRETSPLRWPILWLWPRGKMPPATKGNKSPLLAQKMFLFFREIPQELTPNLWQNEHPRTTQCTTRFLATRRSGSTILWNIGYVFCTHFTQTLDFRYGHYGDSSRKRNGQKVMQVPSKQVPGFGSLQSLGTFLFKSFGNLPVISTIPGDDEKHGMRIT